MNMEDYKKKYEEALRRAREWKEKSGMPSDRKGILDDIFPELKESEDEKIRKAIKLMYSFLPNSPEYIGGVHIKEIFDWLEKRCENNKWKPSKDEMDALYGLAYITNKMDDKKDEAITKLYQDLKREFFSGVSYENMFPLSPVDAPLKLEKQGEQKSIDDLTPQEAMDIAVGKCFEEGEQKPTDEEMKFILRTEYEKGRADAITEMQKPWSEEDEQLYNDLSDTYFYNDEDYPEETYKLMLKRVLDWMTKRAKSLPSQKQWKAVDKEIYVKQPVLAQRKDKSEPNHGYVICYDHTLTPDVYERFIMISDYNQSHWKPSNEQMEALYKASKNEYLKAEQYDVLVSLYNDLKKQRDE